MEQNQKLTPVSQKLRRNQTKEEALLWYQFLRHYPLRFRRQYVIGNYIVDFYCHAAKLIIELDGFQHYDPVMHREDAARDAYLRAQGLQVLRYSNLDVLHRFDAVCQHIDTVIQGRSSD